MEKLLDFLEELIMEYQKKNLPFSQDKEGYIPKVGQENEWKEQQQKIDKLYLIAKIVRSKALELKAEEKSKAAVIAERILDESATVYVFGNADSAEVRVLDELTRNTLAVFRVEISPVFHTLFITERQFCESHHIGTCHPEVSCRIRQEGKCPRNL